MSIMTYEMTELDQTKPEGRLQGWLAGKTPSGKYMMIRISEIVGVYGKWEGPSYILLPGSDCVKILMPLADVVEKIQHFGEPDPPSPTHRVAKAIARLIAIGKMVLHLFFRFTFRKANGKACGEHSSLKLDKP